MTKNKTLHKARTQKNDEYYTQLSDITKEMEHYKSYLSNKIIYCNCDNPLESNFTKYFILNFHELGLKKLICTFYDINHSMESFAFEYDGTDNSNDIDLIIRDKKYQTPLLDDKGFDWNNADECNERGIYGCGDFRSNDCIKYLKEADVVITNPPFSLFREYVGQLLQYNKKFLVIGNGNAITYKEIFPLLKENKIWIGCEMTGCQQSIFVVPNTTVDTNTKERYCDGKLQYTTIVNSSAWFTNIEHNKRNEELPLDKEYSEEMYPKYDNYDVIEVSKVVDIPMDYYGVMGVPISFLGKYCPNQFEILGLANSARWLGDLPCYTIINGKKIYNRILIKRK